MTAVIVGLLGGGGFTTIVVAILNRRRTSAEAAKTSAEGIKTESEALALLKTAEVQARLTLQEADAGRINTLLSAQEGVLANVQSELKRQRDATEADRINLTNEVTKWREQSAACEAKLASEIRIREIHDAEVADLKKELAIAISEIARLVRRAEEDDVLVRTAAVDLLRQVGIKVDEVHQQVSLVKDEVTTSNGITLAALADLAEGRHAETIPVDERTESEQHYVEGIKDIEES